MDDKPDFLDRNSALAAESDLEGEATPVPVEESEPGSVPISEISSRPGITFQGNSYDLTSVIGVTIGAVVVLSCATCNLGFYCLPFIPIILGIIGLVAAKDSVNPDRTKLLSWFSVGSGAAILILMFVFVALYIGFIVFAIIADNGGF